MCVNTFLFVKSNEMDCDKLLAMKGNEDAQNTEEVARIVEKEVWTLKLVLQGLWTRQMWRIGWLDAVQSRRIKLTSKHREEDCWPCCKWCGANGLRCWLLNGNLRFHNNTIRLLTRRQISYVNKKTETF